MTDPQRASDAATRVTIELEGLESIGEFTYVNHTLFQYTGSEIILYGAHVHLPPQTRADDLPPTSVTTSVNGRWLMPPPRFVEHIARSIALINQRPELKHLFDAVSAEIQKGTDA
jgi:hypothetical protein